MESQPSQDKYVIAHNHSRILFHCQQNGYIIGFTEKNDITEAVIEKLGGLEDFIIAAVDLTLWTMIATTFPSSEWVYVMRWSECNKGSAEWTDYSHLDDS